jgi:predicted MFS family arabinose efflux permease
MAKPDDIAKYRNRALLVAVLVLLIIVAHVFLWRSDMPTGLKLTFTILNALGWTIVLAPILLVDKWIDAIRDRNRKD